MKCGSKPKNRMAECHGDRKHYARGLCQACYQATKQQKREGALSKADRDAQPGLMRLHTPGWGSVRGPAT